MASVDATGRVIMKLANTFKSRSSYLPTNYDISYITASTVPQTKSSNVNYFMGSLRYNAVGTNPATHSAITPFIINFTVNGQAGNPQSGTDGTLLVDLVSGDSGRIVAKKIHDAVNSSYVYQLDFLAKPVNADHLLISSDLTDFIFIFHDTAETIPTNPIQSRIPFFIEFQTTQTLENIRDSTREVLFNSVVGIPLPQDLGLTVYDEIDYYMQA